MWKKGRTAAAWNYWLAALASLRSGCLTYSMANSLGSGRGINQSRWIRYSTLPACNITFWVLGRYETHQLLSQVYSFEHQSSGQTFYHCSSSKACFQVSSTEYLMCTNEKLCERSTEVNYSTRITRKYAMADERDLIYLDTRMLTAASARTRIVVILLAHKLARAYTQ